MKALSRKDFGLAAQYALWTLIALHTPVLSENKFVMFVIGIFIVVSLCGMQLRDTLITKESSKEKLLVLALILIFIFLTFLIFKK